MTNQPVIDRLQIAGLSGTDQIHETPPAAAQEWVAVFLRFKAPVTDRMSPESARRYIGGMIWRTAGDLMDMNQRVALGTVVVSLATLIGSLGLLLAR